jgi:type IV pilus assembly protein PilV
MSLSIHKKTSNRRQAGFTLIEVLVATLVLTVGILGVAAMQMVSFQTNQGAYMRSQAVYLAQDILDRMRANEQGYSTTTVYNAVDTSDDATIPASPGCVVTSGGCSALQMGQQDIREWAQNFTNIDAVGEYRPRLMNGVGTITRGAGNEFTVTVTWDERDYDVAGNLTRDILTRTVALTAELN